jgi:hypothetical protein
VKARSVAMTGALAGLGLVAAYATWQRPKESNSTSSMVTVLEASKQSLESVKFEDGQRFLTLKRVAGELWLTSGWVPGKETAPGDAGLSTTFVAIDGGILPDGGAIDAGLMEVSVKAPKPVPTREVRGNERAEAAMQKFMPLEATRALGVLSDEKRAELGLTDSGRRLELMVASTARLFRVAKPLPGIFGTYVQDERTGEVYLLPGTLLSDLDPQSQALVDRRLHTFKQNEFDAFTVKSDGKEASFVQTNAEIPSTAKVARAATPDKPDELVKNWHDKIWSRLIVTEVLGKGELPVGKEPVVSLRIDYSTKGKAKGFVELGVGEGNSMWARSENTASWVSVHQGSDEILIEAKKVVLGQ